MAKINVTLAFNQSKQYGECCELSFSSEQGDFIDRTAAHRSAQSFVGLLSHGLAVADIGNYLGFYNKVILVPLRFKTAKEIETLLRQRSVSYGWHRADGQDHRTLCLAVTSEESGDAPSAKRLCCV